MNHRLCVAAILLATGVGCQSEPVTVNLAGTKGAGVHGYFIRDGRRTDFSGTLPMTLDKPGITLVAVRKDDPASVLEADARTEGGESMSSRIPAGNPDGLRLNVSRRVFGFGADFAGGIIWTKQQHAAGDLAVSVRGDVGVRRAEARAGAGAVCVGRAGDDRLSRQGRCRRRRRGFG